MNRVGFGFDIHPLATGRPLVLGGVTVESDLGLVGHSDADVLSHAVGEALLGALALGDLGRHFPDTDSRYRGVLSLVLLERVVALVGERGGHLVNVDATVLAQAPRLSPRLPEMAKRLADVLGIGVEAVSVKAKSPEGLGLVGRREGIAAMVVVSVEVSVKIYNTLSRKKEDFVPLVPGEVRMYVCGVTPYDLSHIGHARSAMVFDVFRRYLAFRGFRVTMVRNYTDVDDKIIRRANQEGVASHQIAERYIAAEIEDMTSLGIMAPDVAPKATQHIPGMVALIERLVAKGIAYVVDGDVYFEIRRFPPYGRLSGKNLDELLAGARVEVSERKRDARDFALWKSAKPGEPSWPSPWGPGRPGWHIECSVMSIRYLGETFDIHGGGSDLVFPHHECEIAQAEADTGKTFSRYWLHNGMVNLGAEKMSKSLGNVLSIREIVKRHEPDALRLWMLGTHYRNALEWSEERVQESARALQRLRALIDEAERLVAAASDARSRTEGGALDVPTLLASVSDPELAQAVAPRVEAFAAAMDDDVNTPAALAALFDLSRDLYRYRDGVSRGEKSRDAFVQGVDVLLRLGQRGFGLFERGAVAAGPPEESRAAAERCLAEREEARKRRDWKRADELRAEIQALGATVVDTPAGPQLRWGSA